MNPSQARLTSSALLVLMGSLGIVGLSLCSTRERGSRHDLLVKELAPHVASALGKPRTDSATRRGVESAQSTRAGLEHLQAADLPTAFSTSHAAQALTRMASDGGMPTAAAAVPTYTLQSAQVRAMIENSLKLAGLDGDIALPKDVSAANLENVMEQANAVLEQREREARSVAARQQVDLAAFFHRPRAVQSAIASPHFFYLPRPASMYSPMTYPSIGQLNTRGWHDGAAAARREAMQSYDNQMSGSMGWTGYLGDIGE